MSVLIYKDEQMNWHPLLWQVVIISYGFESYHPLNHTVYTVSLYMHCFLVHFLYLVMEHVLTTNEPYCAAPEFVCNQTETTSSTRSQSGCFGAYTSAIAVFTPAHVNCTKELNAPGFDSTELNTVGVNTPWGSDHTHNVLQLEFRNSVFSSKRCFKSHKKSAKSMILKSFRYTYIATLSVLQHNTLIVLMERRRFLPSF